MSDPFAAISFILENIQKLKKINEKIKDAEITGIISDLQLFISDLKLELAGEREKNALLQSRIRELIEQIDISNSVENRDNFIYRKIDENNSTGPYCPRCYGKERKLIALLSIQEAFGCTICHFILKKNGTGIDSGRKNKLINENLI